MKKTFLYSLFFCTTLAASSEKKAFNILDYVKQDIIAFIDPDVSEISLLDFLLDILVVGAGCILAERAVPGKSLGSDLARIAILSPFILSNEYFRKRYGHQLINISKNITYILLYLLAKRAQNG